jgi:hypothetical protein
MRSSEELEDASLSPDCVNAPNSQEPHARASANQLQRYPKTNAIAQELDWDWNCEVRPNSLRLSTITKSADEAGIVQPTFRRGVQSKGLPTQP